MNQTKMKPQYYIHQFKIIPELAPDPHVGAWFNIEDIEYKKQYKWEWIRGRLTKNGVQLVEIPCYIYGYNLFDEVEVDQKDAFVKLVKCSNSTSVRVCFNNKVEIATVQNTISDLVNMGCSVQMWGENFIAIDAPNKKHRKKMLEFLDKMVSNGVIREYEFTALKTPDKPVPRAK